MPEHTVQSLGLKRIWTGLGPRDFAYRGHGYSIEPGTNRYWRLRTIGGKQLATASSRGELLDQLAALIEEAQRGQLNCTRDHNLNPTFTAPFVLTDADRSTIMRFVLQGTLHYEKTGPHGFGVGRLLPRARRGTW